MQSLPSVKRKEVEDGAPLLGCHVNPETVIKFLNEALVTEIICIFRYKRHYFMTDEGNARHVKVRFFRYVAEERAHADQLVERIVQLGGKPDLSLERLLNRSHAEHVEAHSVAEMITADLLAKRIAIENYCTMIASIGADDPTTQQVLERILAQEEVHAESLTSLLREWASQREVR